MTFFPGVALITGATSGMSSLCCLYHYLSHYGVYEDEALLELWEIVYNRVYILVVWSCVRLEFFILFAVSKASSSGHCIYFEVI